MGYILPLNHNIKYIVNKIRIRIKYYIKKLLDLSDSFVTTIAAQPIQESLLKKIGPTLQLIIGFQPAYTWFSSSFQRPQQMARALAATGCKVIYWEPWYTPRNVNIEDRKKRRFLGVRQIEENILLVRCPEKLLYRLYTLINLDVLIMIWPLEVNKIPEGLDAMLVYEIFDDPILYPDNDGSWHAAHQKSLQLADIVTTTADDLYKQVYPIRQDVILLPNAVRLEDWQTEEVPEIPVDMMEIRKSACVVGYFGVFADWMDWNLWQFAAKVHPEWEFVLIGQTYWRHQIPEELSEIENIHFLGPKPHSKLASYAYYFDVATIPFVLNEITHACSPVKLFEYMASGKPVVATPMREIQKYKSVLIGKTPQEFVKQIEIAFSKRNDNEYLLGLTSTANANTWEKRASELVEAIKHKKIIQQGNPRRKTMSVIDLISFSPSSHG